MIKTVTTTRVVDASGRIWVSHSDDLAKYVYLNKYATMETVRDEDVIVASTEELGNGVQVDRDADGVVIGIEFI